MVGAEVAGPSAAEFNGLQVERWPLVSWSPSFAQARSSHGGGFRAVQDSHAKPVHPAALGAFCREVRSEAGEAPTSEETGRSTQPEAVPRASCI